MKIRDGFVSNSSSSSFVVVLRDSWPPNHEKPKRLVTDEQMKLLRHYGFTAMKYRRPPSMIQAGNLPRKHRYWRSADACYYHIICNQDEVVQFLVENRIPFQASCHYGHESLFYDGGEKEVLFIRNPGVEYETYGPKVCGATGITPFPGLGEGYKKRITIENIEKGNF